MALNSVEFLVLAVLADGDRHGYGVVQEVEERTGGEVRLRPGNLYRQLDRLLTAGLVEEGGRAPISGGPPRKLYRITVAGRQVAAREVLLQRRLLAASRGLREAAEALAEGEGA